VWHWVTDFLSKAPSGSLSSDAVIEIMLAILGCMIGILAIIAGLVALIFAGLGVFGFQLIKDEVVRSLEKIAKETAEETFTQEFSRLNEIDSTVALGDAKQEATPSPQVAPSKGRKVSDANLSKGKRT
jgi:hypothetical protein